MAARSIRVTTRGTARGAFVRSSEERRRPTQPEHPPAEYLRCAAKPRTECCCQWVARMMAAIVAPSARSSMASTRACFDPDRKLATRRLQAEKACPLQENQLS